jgi:hypothetical protein
MLENLKAKLENLLHYRWYTLSYHRLKLKFSYNPRTGVCQACGTKGFTARHHWKYAYTYTEIRQDQRRALHYTSELCYPDHDLGDGMRRLFNVDPDLKIVSKSKILNKLVELRAKALKEGGPK